MVMEARASLYLAALGSAWQLGKEEGGKGRRPGGLKGGEEVEGPGLS